MEEENIISVTKQIALKKGETLTITVTLVNASPHKKSVHDFLLEMFQDLLLGFKS